MQVLGNAKHYRQVCVERFATLWQVRHAVDDGIANYGLVRKNPLDGRGGQWFASRRHESAQLLLDSSAALLELAILAAIAVLAWLAYRIAAYIAAASLIGSVASCCLAAVLLMVGYAGFNRRSLDDRYFCTISETICGSRRLVWLVCLIVVLLDGACQLGTPIGLWYGSVAGLLSSVLVFAFWPDIWRVLCICIALNVPRSWLKAGFFYPARMRLNVWLCLCRLIKTRAVPAQRTPVQLLLPPRSGSASIL